MLGIILFICSNLIFAKYVSTKDVTIDILSLIGIIIGLLAYGYAFRVLRSSLVGENKLPSFDNWVELFLVSIKVVLVAIAYYIPIIMFIILIKILYPFALSSEGTILNPLQLFVTDSFGLIFTGIEKVLLTLVYIGYFYTILGFVAFLYLIIITPVMLMALANMANDDSKIGSAFKFKEIIYKIRNIGWNNFIVWYVVTGIVYLSIATVIMILFPTIIGFFLAPLVIVPFLYIYIARSVALLYIKQIKHICI